MNSTLTQSAIDSAVNFVLLFGRAFLWSIPVFALILVARIVYFYRKNKKASQK